ncbi:MAG: mevalonate kinase [Caldilineaceae bacterium]
MPTISEAPTVATAPGKIILVGEHAVVYGRPAIAAPVWGVKAIATLCNLAPGSGCFLIASDINLRLRLKEASDDQPLALVTWLALRQVGIEQEPDWQIELRSELPIAGGLGSGAALSAALVQAIFAHVHHPINAEEVSKIIYESERFYHGTPSGIDNTVIAYGAPLWFVKGEAPQLFHSTQTLHLLIADSGIPSPTKETVGDVRCAWNLDRPRYEAWFDEIAEITHDARRCIEAGSAVELGKLFAHNQALLQQIGVSSPMLDRLIDVAHQAGALGAKLSGGGRGGNVIALIEPSKRDLISRALLDAGAKRVLNTVI